MSQSKLNQATEKVAEPRWKDLYKIGAIISILSVVLTIVAVIAFFIWPFLPGFASTADIFAAIQSDRLGGLMALDFFLFVSPVFTILSLLAFYVALKRVNESYALIALVLGLVSAVLLITARPIWEIVSLSDRYTAAVTDAERSQYLAAGEALLALFNGTAYSVNMFLWPVSFLIFSFLMLRSSIFSRATAYVGIIVNIALCGFFVPGIVGPILLFLGTLGGVVWSVQVARAFLRLGWPSQPAPEEQ